MKIVIEIPIKTNAHIRSNYGHGVKGLRNEDMKILCDAIYHCTLYEERQHGEWIPISEATPEENGYYLTSTIYGEVYFDCWHFDHFDRTETVLAWMKRPKPYKVGKNKEANE